MKSVKSKLLVFLFLLIILLVGIGFLFFKFTRSNIVDLTSLKDNDVYFPLLSDIKNEEDSYAINANSIVFYADVVDEYGNSVSDAEVVIKDDVGRDICTLITDENGLAGVSGLSTSNGYHISLGESVQTSYKRSYQFHTKNKSDSTYRVVFVVTKKEYTSSEYDELVEKYENKIFKNTSILSSLEFTKMHDNWNYLSGCYTFKQKDLVGINLYINSLKHAYDSEDKTKIYLERRFTVMVSDAEVLDYQIKGLEDNPSIKILSEDKEIVVTNYDKDNISSYLAQLIVTFKKHGVIYKTSKTIDLFANQYSNSIIDMTITKDNELLSGATIIIERLSTGSSVSYMDKSEMVIEDSHFQISASSGVYKVTKVYQGEVLDTMIFTIRNNEHQTIVF